MTPTTKKPAKTRYVMSVKKGDHRVLIWTEAFTENTSYVEISEEDAKAVLGGTRTGAQVMRDMIRRDMQKDLDEELAAAETEAAAGGKTDTGDAGGDGTGEDGGKQNPPPAPPPPQRNWDEVLIQHLDGMKVGDLRDFAKAKFELKFPVGTNKEQMTRMLTDKMSE